MNGNDFIKKTADWLEQMNLPYKLGVGADIAVSVRLQTNQSGGDNDDYILYFALIFLNTDKKTVYAYEEARTESNGVNRLPDLAHTAVKTGRDNGVVMTIGSILDSIAAIAGSVGLLFEKTYDKRFADYLPDSLPPMPGKDNSTDGVNAKTLYCLYCGAKNEEGKRFCISCGADLQKEKKSQSNTDIPAGAVPVFRNENPPITVNVNNNAQGEGAQFKQKSSFKKKALVFILLIALLAIAIFLAVKFIKSDPAATQSEEDVSEEDRSEDTQSRIDSAVVSAGVNSSDLGNIRNGQYYFSTENYIFYSSYDENDNEH
ncbi:MAG: zinc ribbon domain-containing protein, partial [Eubacteriales bacterium]|nr:zinc ribbon domain-containing protein [Eubacteriales bacterium]